MAKVLLVDTNRASYTIYQYLVDQAHQVWVVGGDPNEPLAKICPHYIHFDYSDSGGLADIVDSEGFDFLVPGCTDVSYEVCATMNDGRFPGIDTIENAQIINEKDRFRKLAADLRIPTPRVLSESEALDSAAVIVKPTDSFSGRGISVLTRPRDQELDDAHHAACAESKKRTSFIEEFVVGQLYSHSAFLVGSQVVADFIVREDCTASPFTVDTSCLEFDFDGDVLERIRGDVSKLSNYLQLEDGLIHSQFILGEDGYRLIEMTRRCPGDLYAILIEMSTGYPYGASYAAPFLGGRALPTDAATRRERIIRHTLTSRVGESFWGLRFHHPLDIRFFVPLAVAGDFIAPSPQGRGALLFAASPSKAEHDALYQRFLERNLYSFDLQRS